MITNFILYGTAEQKKKEKRKKDGAFWLALALKRRLFSQSLLYSVFRTRLPPFPFICPFLLFVKDAACVCMCVYNEVGSRILIIILS